MPTPIVSTARDADMPTPGAKLMQPRAFKPALDLDAELAAIPQMTWTELRRRWTTLTRTPVPRVKHALLRMALAHELQASAYGGLSRRTEQRLARMTSGAPPVAATGLKLVREWKGTLHTVIVSEDETIHWNGRSWNSLSEVARAITGTRWSGPAFFGLKAKKAAA
jgi:hypothetical protein